MTRVIRNKLRNVVTQCRKLLEEAVTQVLQGQFGVSAVPQRRMRSMLKTNWSLTAYRRRQGLAGVIWSHHLGHIPRHSATRPRMRSLNWCGDRLTHLNRLCAWLQDDRKPERSGSSAAAQKPKPRHEVTGLSVLPRRRRSQGRQEALWTPDTRTSPIVTSWAGWVPFCPTRSGSSSHPPTQPIGFFPPQGVLEDVPALLNMTTFKDIWSDDETIGWVYQYFTPKRLRDQVRKESRCPSRNSYELAFRNQFFTPRYVVEFLTDTHAGPHLVRDAER